MSQKIANRAVGTWLLIGVFMVFMQIIIGGVTRLTGSGLSITKWEIVTGIVPPLSSDHWQQEFDLYKASPQYAQINEGMTMPEFKFIYFWEYFHRFWARLMGFVFAFPFFWFWYKGAFSKRFAVKLVGAVVLAGIVASFGWIMVASGLVDRPYVNAYKLTMHFALAILLYAYVFMLALEQLYPDNEQEQAPNMRKHVVGLTAVLAVQLILGGLMSGMKAGLFFPTWPDMNGVMLPAMLLDSASWTLYAFKHYDTNPFAASAVQFLHRGVAYILTALVFAFSWKYRTLLNQSSLGKGLIALPIVLTLQVLLGILTVINSIGSIPVLWGVLHQAVAILLLTALLYLYHLSRPEKH